MRTEVAEIRSKTQSFIGRETNSTEDLKASRALRRISCGSRFAARRLFNSYYKIHTPELLCVERRLLIDCQVPSAAF